MATKLTPEQRDAIRQTGTPVVVEDDETRAVYLLVDENLHRRAMEALEARLAIHAGLNDLAARRVVPFAEVDARLREELGLAARES